MYSAKISCNHSTNRISLSACAVKKKQLYGRNKGKITKRQHRLDIEHYRHYLKKKQEMYMERLSICCQDHNEIERFKMDFAPIIEKYSFLRDIISRICSKIFEHPNSELREAIIHREVGREIASQEFANRMGAITPLGLETDRRILKDVDYVRGIDGEPVPVLNLDKMEDEEKSSTNSEDKQTFDSS